MFEVSFVRILVRELSTRLLSSHFFLQPSS
uniref:Uncharacterized protein n=1 Tax=Glycine max TaxID=3847 RepID=C6T6P6_SOYBN|nr:unknown [Glycine max]